MSLSVQRLEVFHEVAEAGNVTRAAERLLVTQPAVTRTVTALEQELGTALFERLPRGVRLTEAGRTLHEHTRQIFGLVESASQALEDLRGLHHGRLRFAATPSLAVHLVPKVLVRFRRRFPDIDVHFELAAAAALFDRLRNGVIEFGLIDVAPAPAGVEAETFGEDRLVAVASPRNPITRARSISATKFLVQGLIVRRADGAKSSYVERELLRQGINVRPQLVFDSSEAVKRAVAAGLGVAIVGRSTIDLEIKARELKVINVAGFSSMRPMFVARRTGAASSESKPARAFACMLRAEWRTRSKQYDGQ
jgi:LysR family transcriptional regulator, low CO2-responsive transcriptional regulator